MFFITKIFRGYPNPFTIYITLEFAFDQEEEYNIICYNKRSCNAILKNQISEIILLGRLIISNLLDVQIEEFLQSFLFNSIQVERSTKYPQGLEKF